MKRICVFCGSNPGFNPVYREAARELGRLLAGRGLGLIYGGGRVGLMGILADAVLEHGGEAIGVIPEQLFALEVGHNGLTELRVVRSMHERKASMAELADGFIALPGGYGTFEEFCEIVTWAQLGLHSKPCGLLNVNGFYDGLLGQLSRAVGEGFIQPRQRELVLSGEEPGELLEKLFAWNPETRGNPAVSGCEPPRPTLEP